MKKALLFMLCVSFVSLAVPSMLHAGIENGTGRAVGERADVPNTEDWAHTVARDGRNVIAMTYHHVIPYNVLRDTWTKLIDNGKWDLLKEYMNLLQMKSTYYSALIKKSELTKAEDRDEIDLLLSWPKWNLVEGPTGANRSDDPGEGFDEFDGGLTKKEKELMQKIKILYEFMVRITEERGALSTDLCSKFKTQCKDTAKAVKSSKILRYRPGMWEKDPVRPALWKKK